MCSDKLVCILKTSTIIRITASVYASVSGLKLRGRPFDSWGGGGGVWYNVQQIMENK